MKSFHDLPLETSPGDERGYKLFKDEIWHNSEVCCSCFSQVRTIGPELSKMLETSGRRLLEHGIPLEMVINEWYERTDNGSQEHTTWDYNQRFGTCYCLNCGTDCNGNHRNKSIEELKPLVKNIYSYMTEHTEYEIDAGTFVRGVFDLKQERSAQGHETEVMALAFARAVDPRSSVARSEGTSYTEATAD